MSKKRKHEPVVGLLVSCQMAGTALIALSGQLQERYQRDEEATQSQRDGIVEWAHRVLLALDEYASKR